MSYCCVTCNVNTLIPHSTWKQHLVHDHSYDYDSVMLQIHHLCGLDYYFAASLDNRPLLAMTTSQWRGFRGWEGAILLLFLDTQFPSSQHRQTELHCLVYTYVACLASISRTSYHPRYILFLFLNSCSLILYESTNETTVLGIAQSTHKSQLINISHNVSHIK